MNSASVVVAPVSVPPWVHGPLGLACGMSQWLSHCRSSGQPGFSSPNLALLNPAEVQLFPNWLQPALCSEIRMGFTWAVLRAALFFLCVLIEATSECTWVFCMCQGKYVIFGGDVRDPRYFHSGSPNSTSNNQELSLSSWYFNVVLKERWRGRAGPVFHTSHSPLPQTAGLCKPLSSYRLLRPKASCFFLLSLWEVWTYSISR